MRGSLSRLGQPRLTQEYLLGGNQTVAQRHVREALDEAPEHELARMVDRIVRVPLYSGILAASLRDAASAA